MPAVRPLAPLVIRRLLETKGYTLIGADEFNWAFSRGNDDEPIFVPIKVLLVPFEIASHVMRKVGFESYAEAVALAGDPFPADSASPPPIA